MHVVTSYYKHSRFPQLMIEYFSSSISQNKQVFSVAYNILCIITIKRYLAWVVTNINK